MKGIISQVMGPVVDVDFTDYLPKINEAVEVNFEVEGKQNRLVLEVAAHLGDNRVRTIAMDMSEGLTRGLEATALGAPISVPVGEKVLGRIFNVVGDLIDEGEGIEFDKKWSIHRDPPPFEEQSTKSEIFETGIKVVDLLAPYAKGGKVGLFGGAGVGKTAVVEGLARQIACGEVPDFLQRKRLLEVDLGAMVAGTKYRGEFEDRLKRLIKEVDTDDNVIVFIDELHLLVGAGPAGGAFLGCIGLDLNLTDLASRISSIRIGKTGYCMLMQNDGLILADPKHTDYNLKTLKETDIPAFNEIDKMKEGSAFIMLDGKTWKVSVFSLPEVNWKVALLIEQDEILSLFYTLLKNMILIGLFMFVLYFTLAFIFAGALKRYFKRLETVFGKIAAGDLTDRVAIKSNNEIGHIMINLNTAIEHSHTMICTLKEEADIDQALIARFDVQFITFYCYF